MGTGDQAHDDFGDRFWRAPATFAGTLDPLADDAVPDAEFGRMAENLPVLCWVANGDGYIVWYNRRWHDYCGTTPAAMAGWGWQVVHDPALLPTVLTRWTASIATGEPFEMVFPLRGADEIFRPFLTRVQPLRDATGAVSRWFGTNTEISAQVAAETALRIERDRSSAVLEAMDEGMLLIGPDFVVLDANPALLRIAELDRATVVGRSHWDVWPQTPDTPQGVLYRRVMATGAAGRVEISYVRGGAMRWLEVRAFPHVEGIVVFFRDLTDGQNMAAALRVSEARFAGIVDAIEQMVWLSPPDGVPDFFNQRWRDFTGTNASALQNDGVHPDDVARVAAAWDHSVATGAPYRIEFRMRRVDGVYRWVMGRAECSRDADGRITRWYGTCTDIDDLVAAREVLARSQRDLEALVADRTAALEASQAALIQAQKMEAVGQLTGGIAHDFNNMLSIVIGSLDLARRRADGDPRLARLIDNAGEGARRAAELTARLLAFARQQPLQPTVIAVGDLARRTTELVRRTIGEAVRVETDLAADLWPARADPAQLENALVNLCVNARDAMPGGGVVTIATANVVLDDAFVAAHAGSIRGEFVRLSVADTGAGMPADVVARAFEPFFTTKDVGRGTGLGLSQVYGYVKQSGGYIAIDSIVDHGTTVALYLPRSHDAVAPALAAPPAAAGARAGETILLVEDDDGVRAASAAALTELGYGVVAAGSGAEALDVLDAHPAIVLVMSDVVMPGMTGPALAAAIAQRRPGLPIVFVSGYARDAVAADGSLGPAVAFLAKPFTLDQLAARLRAVLDARP